MIDKITIHIDLYPDELPGNAIPHMLKKEGDFKDLLNNLIIEEAKSQNITYWVLEHGPSNIFRSLKQEVIFTTSIKDILNLWNNNKIPVDNPKDNVWFLNLFKFKSREKAKQLIEIINEDY